MDRKPNFLFDFFRNPTGQHLLDIVSVMGALKIMGIQWSWFMKSLMPCETLFRQNFRQALEFASGKFPVRHDVGLVKGMVHYRQRHDRDIAHMNGFTRKIDLMTSPPDLTIVEDDLTSDEVASLLSDHLSQVHADSPEESNHALGIDGLRSADITVWTAWQGGSLLGIGALKMIDGSHGEIKSMHTRRSARGQGVARAILERITNEARLRGYDRLSLETGTMESFAPARALYMSNGFEPCEPFAEYAEDRNSIFLTRRLSR